MLVASRSAEELFRARLAVNTARLASAPGTKASRWAAAASSWTLPCFQPVPPRSRAKRSLTKTHRSSAPPAAKYWLGPLYVNFRLVAVVKYRTWPSALALAPVSGVSNASQHYPSREAALLHSASAGRLHGGHACRMPLVNNDALPANGTCGILASATVQRPEATVGRR